MRDRFLLRLNSKQSRIVNRCLQELFSKRSLEPMTLEKIRGLGFFELLNRRVKVTSEGREALMSGSGFSAYGRVIEIFSDACSSSHLCTRGDVRKAVQHTYENCWQKQEAPENADEFSSMVCKHINSCITEHTIVAALRGVKLENANEMLFGQLKLITSVKDFVTEKEVNGDDRLNFASVKHLLEVPCLTGSYIGTHEAAMRWYREQAYLVAGMLAVDAGASYEHAATGFHIEPQFDQASGDSGSALLFWSNPDRYLGLTISGNRGQTLTLTAERIIELNQPGAFVHAFNIFQKHCRSDMEDGITRAVYWYGDAHRDSVPVMQFIKYWSCLECLLGGPGEEITETLAVGVVTVLTFGHFRSLDVAEWEFNVRSVKRLYAIRSKAVHRASHSHVTFRDVVMLGTWTAWVIYNAISFSHSGMQTTKNLWEQVSSFARERENKAQAAPPESAT